MLPIYSSYNLFFPLLLFSYLYDNLIDDVDRSAFIGLLSLEYLYVNLSSETYKLVCIILQVSGW